MSANDTQSGLIAKPEKFSYIEAKKADIQQINAGSISGALVAVSLNIPYEFGEADVSRVIFAAPSGYRIVGASSYLEALAGGAVSANLWVTPSGGAAGSGFNAITWDLNANLRTGTAATLLGTDAQRTLAAGDAITISFTSGVGSTNGTMSILLQAV